MAWPIGETVVLSFGNATKPLSAGEIRVSDIAASITTITTKQGSVTGSVFNIATSPDFIGGTSSGNNTLSFAPNVSTQSMSDHWVAQFASNNNISITLDSMPAGIYSVTVAGSKNVASIDVTCGTNVQIIGQFRMTWLIMQLILLVVQ
jgi:hypothetical protein